LDWREEENKGKNRRVTERKEENNHYILRERDIYIYISIMDGPPPPPPPHGANPNTTEGTPKYRKSTDLPDGPYDIFVVPPHSAGSGFIYLPSLQCHRNSFIAGSLSTLLVVAIWAIVQPTVKTWMATTNATGGMGVVLLVVAVGFCGWYFGTMQSDTGGSHTGNRPRPGSGFGGSGYQYNNNNAHQGQNGAFPGGDPQYNNTGGHFNAGSPPPQSPPHQHTHQNTQQNTNTNPPPKEDPKKAEAEWERAREETKRKEDLKRKMEAFRKKREEEEAQKRRKQEREAMEKELKERKEQLEKEAAAAKAAAEREVRERAEREAAEKEERARKEAAEREERAKKAAAEKEAAAKEAAKKEAAIRFAAAKESAAKKFAEAKEKAAREKVAREKGASAAASSFSAPNPTPAPASAPSAAPPRTTASSSPQKPPPRPTARTATNNDDDAYSFRPYDRPRRPYGGASAPSVYSESSSYAPSHSTARTTPPPSHSHHGPYTTKDPKKVVIHGVYAFNNAFQNTPIAQLVSGQRPVTDGLVLRISTEGWFVDDDVRGVAQREWDAKAWTMKIIEVCFFYFFTKILKRVD
jgi:hypothetical protein